MSFPTHGKTNKLTEKDITSKSNYFSMAPSNRALLNAEFLYELPTVTTLLCVILAAICSADFYRRS